MTDYADHKITDPGVEVHMTDDSAATAPDDDPTTNIEFDAVAPPTVIDNTHYTYSPSLEDLRDLYTYDDGSVHALALVGGQSWTLNRSLYERAECGQYQFAYINDEGLRVEQCTGCGDYRTTDPA